MGIVCVLIVLGKTAKLALLIVGLAVFPLFSLPLLFFSLSSHFLFSFSISCSFSLAEVIFMIVKPECKCTKHGTCDLNGHCLCDVGWFGPTCSGMHYLER